MSETKHTPGPWHTFRCIAPSRAWSINATQKNTIAMIGGGSLVDKSDEEIEANARLIAAAPELLQAAYSALKFIEEHEHSHGRRFGAGNELRKAVAKAEGQSS